MELLVVILIIGVLVAVAAPAFLGQTEKAHDSRDKQYLTVAYRAAAAASVDYEGDFGGPAHGAAAAANMVQAINASEPELHAVAGDCPADATADPTHIVVDPAATGAGELEICNDPDHTVWTLKVVNHQLSFQKVTVSGSGVVSPSNLAPPAISGTAQLGQALTATTGSWDNSPTGFSYQWQVSSNGSSWAPAAGAGATTSSYTPAVADLGKYLRVSVQAANAAGEAAAVSASTAAVLPLAPANQSPPTISGAAQAGQTLTAQAGVWSGNPTGFSYQWQRSPSGSNWTNVGSDSSSYVVTAADVNYYLRVVVQAENAGGSGSASSNATSLVLAAVPANQTPPTVSGTAQVGQTLTGDPGSWSGNPTSFSYQWRRATAAAPTSFTDIAAATAQTYVVQAADAGDYLTLCVQAENASGAGAACSDPTALVADVPQATTSPSISSSSSIAGATLTGNPGSWSGSPSGYSYQWQSAPDGSTFSDVATATATSYQTASTDAGSTFRFCVTATNAQGDASACSSGFLVRTPADGYDGAVLADGAYAYYKLDDTANGTAVDSAAFGGTARNLTAGGSPSMRAQGAMPGSYAASFNGSSQYFERAGFATVDNYSLEAWVKYGSLAQATGDFVSHGGIQGSCWQGAFLSAINKTVGSIFAGSCATTAGPTSGNVVTDTASWHYVVLTRSGGSATLYVDGAVTASGAAANQTAAPYFAVGRRGGGFGSGNYFSGSVDDVAFYNKVLTCGTTTVGQSCSAGSQIGGHWALANNYPPANQSPPTLAVYGYYTAGTTLSLASNGGWLGLPTSYGYQWQRCAGDGSSCVDIDGATASSYTTTSDDVDASLRVKVTAANSLGSGSAFSGKASYGYPGYAVVSGATDIWRLDEASGATFKSIKTTNPLTSAGATVTDGVPGALVGSADTAVSKTTAGSLRTAAGSAYTATGNFSVAGWFYVTDNTIPSSGNPYLFANGNLGVDGWGLIMNYGCTGTGCLSVLEGGVNVASLGYQIPANKWVYLTLTHDTANAWRLYVNGAQAAAAVTSLSAPIAASPAAGEAFYTLLGVPARVDDVAYWNATSLGQGTVAKLYAYGASTYAQAVLADGPLAAFRLDSSLTGEDLTAAGHAGVWSSAPTLLAGPTSDGVKGATMTGSNYLTATPVNSDLDFSGTQPFSLEMWIKPNSLAADTTSYHFIADGEQWPARTGWMSQINNVSGGQRVTLERYSNGTYAGGYGILISKLSFTGWNYLVFTYDGAGNVCGYLNGAKDGCWAGATSIASYSGLSPVFGIPGTPGSPGYSGGLADVALYNKALTTAQVSAHWNAR